MLSTATDYRDVNQNHSERAPHMGQKVYRQLTKERTWREESPAVLWVGL